MDWIWWAIGAFGIGGALLFAAVLIFGWPVIIGTRLGRMALAVGAGIVAVFGVFLKGKSEGAAKERARQNAERQKINRKIDAIEDDIADNTPDENREELKKWSE